MIYNFNTTQGGMVYLQELRHNSPLASQDKKPNLLNKGFLKAEPNGGNGTPRKLTLHLSSDLTKIISTQSSKKTEVIKT